MNSESETSTAVFTKIQVFWDIKMRQAQKVTDISAELTASILLSKQSKKK